MTAVPDRSVWVFDAMAVIRAQTHIPDTFDQLAAVVLNSMLGTAVTAPRIDFVGDQYPIISIKNAERTHRANEGQISVQIAPGSQNLPQKWKCLAGGSNKLT